MNQRAMGLTRADKVQGMRARLEAQAVGAEGRVGKGFAFDAEERAIPFADLPKLADRDD